MRLAPLQLRFCYNCLRAFLKQEAEGIAADVARITLLAGEGVKQPCHLAVVFAVLLGMRWVRFFCSRRRVKFHESHIHSINK